jgi:hypothetical protein
MHRMTTSPSSGSPESAGRQELRRRTIWLLGSVIAVHGLMIGLYYALHVQARPTKTQQTFIAVWLVLTIAVIVPQMKEIRKFRRPGSRR